MTGSRFKRSDRFSGEWLRAVKQEEQIVIEEGAASGGDFDIAPVRQENGDADKRGAIARRNDLLISLQEEHILLLLPYLEYYLDENRQKAFRDPSRLEKGFEWYDENVYSYESVAQMALDLLNAADCLETDWDNPRLYDLKRCFRAQDLVDDRPLKMPDEVIIRANIHIITGFCRRISDRLVNYDGKCSGMSMDLIQRPVMFRPAVGWV